MLQALSNSESYIPKFPLNPSNQILPTHQIWQNNIKYTIDIKPITHAGTYLTVSDDSAPFEILAFNPDGLKTGYNPTTKEIITEDPAISYGPLVGGGWSGPFLINYSTNEEKYLTITDPFTGNYRFEIIGTDDAKINLNFSLVSDFQKINVQHIEKDITKNEIIKYEVNYQSINKQANVTEVPNFTPEARAGNDVNGVIDIGALQAAVEFDATRSFDIDGQITSYLWDFGDGILGSGQKISHSYKQAGKYEVKLTVTDNQGSIDTDTTIASISQLHLPIANPSGPYIGWASSENISTYINFGGQKSYDPDRSIIQEVYLGFRRWISFSRK